MTTELKLAIAVAEEAGEVLRQSYAAGSEVFSEIGRDIKLAADVEAERVILARLRAATPHPVLSEEAGADAGLGPTGWQWVVDPLDGTYNFSRRLPVCCVSIGFCDGPKPVAGVIYDFLGRVTYAGQIGHGAWRNGEPMRVSGIGDLKRAMLCTGFPSGGDYGEDSLMGFVRQAQGYKKVRLLGSAALSLALVAAGVVEAYEEDNIQWWDVAAGLALVEAAGGAWLSQSGAGGWKRRVFAQNGRLPVPESFLG